MVTVGWLTREEIAEWGHAQNILEEDEAGASKRIEGDGSVPETHPWVLREVAKPTPSERRKLHSVFATPTFPSSTIGVEVTEGPDKVQIPLSAEDIALVNQPFGWEVGQPHHKSNLPSHSGTPLSTHRGTRRRREESPSPGPTKRPKLDMDTTAADHDSNVKATSSSHDGDNGTNSGASLEIDVMPRPRLRSRALTRHETVIS